MKCILPILFLAACSSNLEKTATPWTPTEPEPTASEVTAEPDDTAASSFVVHEWGTFTSLQGSDGTTQPGMHYEEEALPAFVYGRVPPNPTGPATKQVEDTMLDGITQKLETPVLYFYNAPESVEVTVDFPDGVISQWYPDALRFAPEVYAEQFDPTEIAGGTMSWRVTTHAPTATEAIVPVPEDDVWAPSRHVPDAQVVSVGDEFERFIFYRGLGRFEMPVRVVADGETFEVRNDGDATIPSAYLLHWTGEVGEVWPLGSIGPGASARFQPTPKELPQTEYLEKAKGVLVDGLIADGLTDDEAWSMVNTWTHSYFKTPGWRVLYVTPRPWTDALLPITISPAPDALVRTMVGRIEIMTATEEHALLEQLERGERVASEQGRLAEAKLQRLLFLSDREETRQLILEQIVEVRTTP